MSMICSSCKYKKLYSREEPCCYCSVINRGLGCEWVADEEYNLTNEKHKPKTRADFLKEVEGIICKDRNEQYGEPEDNFKRIANFWSDYLECDISPADVAIMMVLFKAARIATGHNKEDNWIDLIGYGACGAECAVRGK